MKDNVMLIMSFWSCYDFWSIPNPANWICRREEQCDICRHAPRIVHLRHQQRWYICT
uniref:Uncharacterized protein n=1 Tax=Arundo donax TaxID=35708 RepID=A0A0A9EJ96_ARUDO